MQMNPEYKALWLAALRSGDYLQCREAMRVVDTENHERFCLLGLLAEVMRQTFPDKYVWVYSLVTKKGEVVYNLRPIWGKDDIPSPEHWKELDALLAVDFDEATLDYLGDELKIPELNDDFGVEFEEAAELIEAQL